MLQNADVIIGGNPLNRDGFYFEPTLVKCDDPNSPLVKQEIFGPVLTIQTFKNIEEPVPWLMILILELWCGCVDSE